MYKVTDIAPTSQAKLYLVAIHELLSQNVPKELNNYREAANEMISSSILNLKSPRSGPTIDEMGLKPTKQ